MTEKNEQSEAQRIEDATKVEVRLNEDDSLDEIVGTGWFHLEQMDYNKWWMSLGPHNVWLSAKGKITASIELNAYPQQSLATPPLESESPDVAQKWADALRALEQKWRAEIADALRTMHPESSYIAARTSDADQLATTIKAMGG